MNEISWIFKWYLISIWYSIRISCKGIRIICMETWTHRDKRIALQDCIVIVFSVKKRYCIMKKQFAAIFAATAVLGVTTAFAANPFSDVTPDSWAYQAVT